MMAGDPLARPDPRCIPGKEDGVHARYDAEGRELVYIGVGDMVMHRDVIDEINAEWDRVFGCAEPPPAPSSNSN